MNFPWPLPKDCLKLVQISKGCFLEQKTAEAFKKLQNHAKQTGIDLQIVSAYRDHERQITIWNQKVQGIRPILDDNEKIVDITKLNKDEFIQKLLRWSSPPGLSRHHWGSDLDVFDAGQITLDKINLVPSEYKDKGPCSKLNQWLGKMISENTSFGFFRPYDKDLGGVAIEKWHLSYKPLSELFMQKFNKEIVEKVLKNPRILLHDILLKKSSWILDNFIRNIS